MRDSFFRMIGPNVLLLLITFSLGTRTFYGFEPGFVAVNVFYAVCISGLNTSGRQVLKLGDQGAARMR